MLKGNWTVYRRSASWPHMACSLIISWQADKNSGVYPSVDPECCQCEVQREVSKKVRKAILGPKKQNKPVTDMAKASVRLNQQLGPFFKRRNPVANWATPKDQSDVLHRKTNGLVRYVASKVRVSHITKVDFCRMYVEHITWSWGGSEVGIKIG